MLEREDVNTHYFHCNQAANKQAFIFGGICVPQKYTLKKYF